VKLVEAVFEKQNSFLFPIQLSNHYGALILSKSPDVRLRIARDMSLRNFEGNLKLLIVALLVRKQFPYRDIVGQIFDLFFTLLRQPTIKKLNIEKIQKMIQKKKQDCLVDPRLFLGPWNS
jgi:hypothetical protein